MLRAMYIEKGRMGREIRRRSGWQGMRDRRGNDDKRKWCPKQGHMVKWGEGGCGDDREEV